MYVYIIYTRTRTHTHTHIHTLCQIGQKINYICQIIAYEN